MLKKYKWILIISSVLILLPMVFGLIMWNNLPEQMIIHWGISGEADGSAARSIVIFVLPLILLAIHWVCVVISFVDNKSRNQTERAMKIVLWIIPVISLYANSIVYATAFGLDFDVYRIISLIVGIGFIIIGNYLPKFSRNRTVGIKIYWALRSDDNWNKTHRFGGRVWCICGLLFLVCFFLPEIVMYYFMIANFAVAIIAPIVYSYCYYRKQLKAGEIEKEKIKASNFISVILLTVLLITCVVFCFSGNISYTVSEEDLIIKPTYEKDVTVKFEDIQFIEYRDNGVDGKRIFGFGSLKLLLGTFNNDELGNYTRYTYYGEKDCIILSVNGGKIVIGCEKNEDTRALYENLIKKCSSAEVK